MGDMGNMGRLPYYETTSSEKSLSRYGENLFFLYQNQLLEWSDEKPLTMVSISKFKYSSKVLRGMVGHICETIRNQLVPPLTLYVQSQHQRKDDALRQGTKMFYTLMELVMSYYSQSS